MSVRIHVAYDRVHRLYEEEKGEEGPDGRRSTTKTNFVNYTVESFVSTSDVRLAYAF